VLYDAGLVNFEEPFDSLLTQGMVIKEGAKMSKSKGNVVSPEEIVNKYGADTARTFILFAAPPDRDLEWSDQGVEGSYRFLGRMWRLVDAHVEQFKNRPTANHAEGAAKKLWQQTHFAIKKVSEDIGERYQFNTAISAIMELVNAIYTYPNTADRGTKLDAIETAVLLLSPVAPHITEELWQMLGHQESIHLHSWPAFEAAALVQDEIEYAIQVNGKVRDRMVVSKDAAQEDIKAMAMELERVKEMVEGKEIKKFIVVPGKLVNIVIG
jgi:leucyl-tRNA synthetase